MLAARMSRSLKNSPSPGNPYSPFHAPIAKIGVELKFPVAYSFTSMLPLPAGGASVKVMVSPSSYTDTLSISNVAVPDGTRDRTAALAALRCSTSVPFPLRLFPAFPPRCWVTPPSPSFFPVTPPPYPFPPFGPPPLLYIFFFFLFFFFLFFF